MILLKFILIAFSQAAWTAVTGQSGFYKLLSKKVSSEVNPYLVVNFVSNDTNKNPWEKSLNTQGIPNIVSSKQALISKDNDTGPIFDMTRSIVKNSLEESLVLFNTHDFDDIRLLIDFLLPRMFYKLPKCLILLFVKSTNSDFDKNIKDVLEYAWKKNFLDFSIIVRTGNDKFIFHMNPFYNVSDKRKFLRNTKIFPDKLQNANRYPYHLLVPMDQRTTIVAKKNGKFEAYFGENLLLQEVIRKINFKTIIIRRNDSGRLLISSRFNELNIDSFTYGITLWNSFDYTCCNRESFFPSYARLIDTVALVPKIPILRTEISLSEFVNAIVIVGLLAGFIWASKFIKNVTENLSAFDAVKLILGQSISQTPRKTIGRIYFLTSIMLFVLISNAFIADIVKEIYTWDEIPFESHKDLDDSGVEIYTANRNVKEKFGRIPSNKYFNNIANKICLLPDYKTCVNNIVESKNAACIVFDTRRAELFIANKYGNKSGKRLMKIAKPQMLTQIPVFLLKTHSPYLEKIQIMHHRIRESGVGRIMTFINENTTRIGFSDENEDEID